MDPYSMLMHYKRAFKLLDAMKKNGSQVLVLGDKKQVSIDWKGRFNGIEFNTGVVDEMVISSAPKHYDLILCTDPVLYAKSLRNINVPVMMMASAKEITQYPEILDVTDYLLPSPTGRHDAALMAVMSADHLRQKEHEALQKRRDEERKHGQQPPRLTQGRRSKATTTTQTKAAAATEATSTPPTSTTAPPSGPTSTPKPVPESE
eukprot:CAMPEP_0206480410 /NCGR_PEP_ID=MMETSP0324_2-20121206/37294_1 /ASSEMBLY_ACC=CAM_ASM_000836 /TAXON_ID=2866 /ORGANISM="Crypthecodinium cohnii, Strain Seligo" /LENGTH=204 /DNA_ID=CAMNT_0053957225 /DNA_START=196 /DNA_END=810 /DNA_ORIENTATION=-